MANTQVHIDGLMFIKIYDELNHVLIKKEMYFCFPGCVLQGIFRRHQNDSQPGWQWGQVSDEKAYSIFLLFLFCKAQKVKIGIQGHMGGGRRRHNK